MADVWIVELDVADPLDLRVSALLSAEERTRASRFHRDADRQRYAAAHVALRVLLAQRLRHSPDTLAFSTTASGKPCLEGHALRFNLSHAGNHIVVGISASAEIGVDTEPIDSAVGYLDTARTTFPAAELAWMEQATESERLRRFCRLWVIREALVKAAGRGLAAPMSEIALTIVDDRPLLDSGLDWHAHEAPDTKDHVAAAVVPTAVPVRWHTTSWSGLAAMV